MTITAFRHSLRVRLALDRLRDRSADLTTVALDLGYASHSHFTSVFRRHVGMTPSQYRMGSGL
jgi:AraC-like DNA-binding protein